MPLYAVDINADVTTTEVIVVGGRINGQKITALIDGGAGGDFISRRATQRLGITIDTGPSTELIFADGRRHVTAEQVSCSVGIGPTGTTSTKIVLPQSPYDVILGRPWLATVNPDIDWKTNVMRLLRECGTLIPPKTGTCHLVSAVQAKKLL